MKLNIMGVTKEFKGFRAVNNFSCNMENGVYGLLGVNGAGKTTLMRMICTLIKPTEGQITWDGNDIFKMDGEYRRILGYLPQDFGYYPEFTVYDYLMYIASIKGLSPSVAKYRGESILNQVGLIKERNVKMRKLSGGMKRRVGIAQALLNDPKVLILDEPTAGLDPNERIRFRNLISELSDERIVILSTHIVSDVEFIAKKIIIMKDGELREFGTSDEIISSMKVKVWKVWSPKSNVNFYMERFKVSNIKNLEEGAELRIISEQKPVENALETVVSLEDVFLYYFGEKAEVKND